MFEQSEGLRRVASPPEDHAPSTEELHDLLDRLATCDGTDADGEAALVDQLTVLERVKSAAAAAQARVTATLATHRYRAEADRGMPARERGRGLAAEIGLARRESPVRGGCHLGMGTALVAEMPHTLAALTRGDISEYRAQLMVKETALLTREHRTQVDTELADRLTTLGDRGVAAAARTIGYRLDPTSVLRRTRGATADRHVSLRPAPDTMTYLSGFLPVAQGVACKVALERHAETLRSQGDPRTRGQIMADTLVERLTGQGTAEATGVEIELVMTDRALFGGDHEPAHLTGYGPIPAAIAREIVRDAHHAWLRRLYTSPDGSALVAMDSHRRLFTGQLRHFLIIRDQVCRTPWCDAPIRHLDHAHPDTDGGPTTAVNGQGLCEACNYAKQATGWRAQPAAADHDTGNDTGDPRHTIEITTPTGHHHHSRAPNPPGAPRTRSTGRPRVDYLHPDHRHRIELAA